MFEQIECQEEDNVLIKEEITQKEVALREWKEALRDSEILWAQKPQCMWRNYVDKTTKYFHIWANVKQNRSIIYSLLINRHRVENMEVINDHIVDFYENLYKEYRVGRPNLGSLEFVSIDEEEGVWLERNFSEEEVSSAITRHGRREDSRA